MNYTIEGKGPSPVSTDDVRARDAATRAAQAKYILPNVPRGMDANFVADVCGAIAVLVASKISGVSFLGQVDTALRLNRGTMVIRRTNSSGQEIDVAEMLNASDAAHEVTRRLGIVPSRAAAAWYAIVPLLRGANGVLDGITLTDDPNDAAIVHCTITKAP